MIDDVFIGQIDLRHESEKEQLRAFLEEQQLKLEEDIQSAFGVFGTEGELLGCGCAAGELLKCIALHPSVRGENVMGLLLPKLVEERFSVGYYDLFIITRARNEVLFSSCGFSTVAKTDSLVMLENCKDGPERFAETIFRKEDAGKTIGAIVMNANPFTAGHRYLVEYGASCCDVLHVFVVEEERSAFPTKLRYELVKKGTADISNVRVHLSGSYMISSATFPTYFLKDNENAAALQSELDITIFASRLAPSIGITKRFAGEEPLDPITAQYNAAMGEILPKHGIEFICIPRLQRDGKVINASLVRTLLREQQGLRAVQDYLTEPVIRCLEEQNGTAEDF